MRRHVFYTIFVHSPDGDTEAALAEFALSEPRLYYVLMHAAGEVESDESLPSGGAHRDTEVDELVPSFLRRTRWQVQMAGA